MHFLIVRIILYSMKLIGLAPFSIQTKKTANKSGNGCKSILIFSKTGLVYNFIVGIFLLFIITFILIHLGFKDSDIYTYYIYIINFLIRGLTVYFIITVWCVGQRNAIKIINRLLEIDNLLRDLKHDPTNKMMFIFSVIHIIANFGVWLIIFHQKNFGFGSWSFDYVLRKLFNTTASIIINLFTIQYILVIRFVIKNMRIINKNLLYFNEFQNYSYPTPFLVDYLSALRLRPINNWQLATLKSLRNIRTTLRELSQEIANFFSFPILVVITGYSVNILFYTTDLIQFCINLSDHGSKIGFWSYGIRLMASTIVIIHPFMLTLADIRQYMDEAKLTTNIVNKLMAEAARQEIKAELEDFSFQLLNDEIEFTAYGFFTLDYKLMHSILGTSASYYILLHQFRKNNYEAT